MTTEVKTMSALAEILEENGVTVLQAVEEDLEPDVTPCITFFAEKNSDAFAVAGIAKKHGYRNVKSLVHSWLHIERMFIDQMWCLNFYRSGVKPLSFSGCRGSASDL